MQEEWGVLLGYQLLGGEKRSRCFNSGYHDLVTHSDICT